MKIKWHNRLAADGRIILAADVGGTNSNIAVVQKTGHNFSVILECVFPTDTITDFLHPVKLTVEEFNKEHPGLKPDSFCVSAAGPVNGRVCQLTNATWSIDAEALSKNLGIPCSIINDFSAISYGIPLLDTANPEQITVLPHTDGSTPDCGGPVKAVIGAGTGLGVGYLYENDDQFLVFPSEGGHADFSGFDEESLELRAYMAAASGKSPGNEVFVSGQGIVNIFRYFRDVKKVPMKGVLAEIDASAPKDIPRLLSVNSAGEKVCAEVLELFVKCFARAASNAAVTFLPYGGLYLAGGIVTKDFRFFQNNNLFMKYFEMNYNKNIKPILDRIPVYIIRDYSVSLYGAANAASRLIR